MRKTLLRFALIALAAVFCLLPWMQTPARAESSGQILSVGVTAKPDSLLEPGDVTLSFTIENTSDYDVGSVTLSSADGLESEPLGRIAAGSTETFARTHAVTQTELDAGEITFILSHDDPLNPEHKINYGIHARLRRSDTEIRAELIRRFSTRTPAAGGTVTVTYRVLNTGNVPLNLLRVQDTFGDFNARIDHLAPGESSVLVSRVTVSEPAVSHASLLYCAEVTGEKSYTSELADVPIELSDPHLEMQFSADVLPFSTDTADVLLILTNTGNADYEEITVTDELLGGSIAEGLRLPAGGEPVEVERTFALRGDGSFRWRVTGRCADGSELNAVTETVRLERPSGDLPPQLSLDAEVDLPRIRRAGDVHLHVRLDNPGGADLTDVVLTEAARGDLRTFAVLPAESGIERDFTFRVESDTVFELSAACVGLDGETLRAEAEPVQVAIASDGVLPEGERDHFIEFTGSSVKIGGSSLFAVLLIAGCGILILLIVMLIVASRRARIQKQARIAEEKRRKHSRPGKSGTNHGKGRAK